MEFSKRPEIWILVGLILALLPISIGLSIKYSSLVRLEKVMLPLPGIDQLTRCAREVSQGETEPPELVYAPKVEPETGIARVYSVGYRGRPRYALMVLRYRITCQVCKDVMAVAVYHLEEKKLVKVFLPEPWEVKDGPVDTDPFLAQFEGRPLNVLLQGDSSIDGITGATSSANGLISRLDEAAVWIAQREREGMAW